MRWVWPLSWHYRIRELQAENELLRAQVRKLDNQLTASRLQHTSLTIAYTSAVASLAALAATERIHRG